MGSHTPNSDNEASDTLGMLGNGAHVPARHEKLPDLVMAYQQNVESLPAGSRHAQDTASVKPPLHRRIRTLEKSKDNSLDVIGRLRSTWMGKFYVHRLKRISLVRQIVIWSWRVLFPFVNNHLRILFAANKIRRWYPLIKHAEYLSARNISVATLLKAAWVAPPHPKVFPIEDQGYISASNASYNFPSVYVAAINNALVYGGTNLVLTQDVVICHDLYDFKRDYTSEELHGRTRIDARRHRVRWLRHDDTPEYFPVAATFVDACAANYAHWLTEVLPRISAFCSNEKLKSIPIIINDGLHENIMESLFLISGPEREIIALPIGRALQIDILYITSVAGYVPFERRSNKLQNYSQGQFNPLALDQIRNSISTHIVKIPNQVWPEKIYLRRNSGTRKISNSEELEKLFTSHGYIAIEPERLTFLQQVQLFTNAKEVVTSTGAALASAIFCRPGTRICVLMAKHENMIFRYWLNMLAPLQIEVVYVLGVIDTNHHLGIHADFFVNSNDIINFFEYEKKNK